MSRYKYRNLPCTAAEPEGYHIAGTDSRGGGGVLEWCYDEQDAEERLALMLEDKRFVGLRIARWEDRP